MSETTPEPVEPTEPVTEPTEPTTEPAPTEPTEPTQPDEEPAQPEQADEPAPSPPEPQSGATQEEWEARFSKSEQRFKTYERAVFGIFEDDAHDLIDCPLCLGPVRGFIDKNALGHFPPEQVALVKQVIGITAEMEYPASSKYHTCTECDGTGRVTTGSKVAGQENIGCGECNERGWIGPEVAVAATNGHVENTATNANPPAPPSDLSTPDPDEFNQPRVLPDGRLNPNYGRRPNFWIEVPPWGSTQGLTAQDAVSA